MPADDLPAGGSGVSESGAQPRRVVEFQGVRKTFARGAPVLEDVSFSIREGEFVSLLGPSGCGKSTILRMVAGLTSVTAGTLQVDGGRPKDARRRLAYIFQEATLLPWLTVSQNVELLLKLRGVRKQPRRERARAMLQMVHLEHVAGYYPRELSGGMRMRVSVARALALQPRLMLLDEPFGAVDEMTRHRLNEELRSLQRVQRCSAVFVTHSVDEAVFLSDRILVMNAHPGRIAAEISVPLPEVRSSLLRESESYARHVIQVARVLREASNLAA